MLMVGEKANSPKGQATAHIYLLYTTAAAMIAK